MKERLIILGTLCLIALLLMPVMKIQSITSHAQDEVEAAQFTSDYVRGRVLVKIRSGVSASHVRKFMSRQEAFDVEEITNTRIHVMQLPKGADEKAFIQSLKSQPEVEFAELDYLVPPAEM